MTTIEEHDNVQEYWDDRANHSCIYAALYYSGSKLW